MEEKNIKFTTIFRLKGYGMNILTKILNFSPQIRKNGKLATKQSMCIQILYIDCLQKKTARTSQKEEEVGELPRATEVTGGRRSF
jgi:hypothetical protein